MGGDHWKSLANKLGAPGVDAPMVDTTLEPAPRPAPPAPEKPVALPAQTGRRHDTAPPPVAAAPETPAPPVREPSPPPRGSEKGVKRKSSWDTLTSFFGIASAPGPVEEPAVDISSAAPGETDALESPPSRRSAFGGRQRHGRGREVEAPRALEAKSEEARPTALDSLFGEAPRQPLSWEKPAPRRMVDDVSGWDEEEPTESLVDAELEAESDEPGLAPLTDEDTDAEAPQRRRRRRRRGGARRDREDGTAPQAGRGEPRQAGAPRGDLPAGEEWAEEEGPEAVESSERWAEPEAFESQSGEEAEGAVPERRSSRRRRRGGRTRERTEEGAVEPRGPREPVEARAPREPRSTREPRPPRELEGREPRPPREAEGREPREAREPREQREPRPTREPRPAVDEGPVTAERSRREQRQRPPRAAEAPRRELAATAGDELDDEVDSSLAAELEEGGPNRHPKIPTWADSLEAIITANMDNHRRVESQRGGASRGRPRSGGGGNGGGAARR